MAKAFLLAAGKGTRLKPLTDVTAKCLLPLLGKPLLQYWFSLCEQHGVSDVLVNLHHHADQVRSFVTSRKWSVRIHLAFESTLLGSAGTLNANRDFVADEESFAILYADNLTNINLSAMREAHRRGDRVLTMGLFRAANPSACGIVEMDEECRIVKFVEKPVASRSNLANAGIYWCSRSILEHLPTKVPADIGYDLLPRLVGQMHGYVVEEYLRDIGTPESYAQAQLDAVDLSREGKLTC